MAYRGRGGFSHLGGGIDRELGPNDNNDELRNDRMYYGGGFFRRYYYIPVDNTYVIFQIIVAIIIFAVAGITFLTTYKPAVIDPIENIKRIILNTYIILLLVLVSITILLNYFSKDKNALIKRLIAVLALSTITLVVLCGIKLKLDSTYTESKFESIYREKNGKQTSDIKTKFNVGLTSMQMKTEKEYYVDECVNAYNVFTIRMYGIMGLNILLIILLLYQISKISKIQGKRDKLSKDDEILFGKEKV